MFPIPDSELSVVIDGPGAAEIWRGSSLLAILYEQQGAIVLRLESHARRPLPLSAIALERALAEARERLTLARAGAHRGPDEGVALIRA
jgi:hypothetical protein